MLKSGVLETERKLFDEEATLFAGKAFSIRSAQKIGLDDLIRVLDNEIQVDLIHTNNANFCRHNQRLKELSKSPLILL